MFGIAFFPVSQKLSHPRSLRPSQTNSMSSHTLQTFCLAASFAETAGGYREIETMCSRRVTTTSAVVNGAAGKTNSARRSVSYNILYVRLQDNVWRV